MRPKKKKTKQRKCPSCLFTLIPRYPSIANHLFLKGYLYMWPEKETAFGGRRAEGKEEEEEEVSYLNHKCLPMLTPASSSA